MLLASYCSGTGLTVALSWLPQDQHPVPLPWALLLPVPGVCLPTSVRAHTALLGATWGQDGADKEEEDSLWL